MPVFTLVTWNMQGGNDDKWSRIFEVESSIKCLQECSSPPAQFTDKFGETFLRTKSRTVVLNYEATKYDFRGASTSSIHSDQKLSDLKPKSINYRSVTVDL